MRPTYRLAGLIFALVLAGYAVSLAPTVTFWDAGEFIAAARTLGIPHPPGTPLFVMLAHVWGALVPFGEYAERLNLLSAGFSAGAAALFFLVAHEILAGGAGSQPSNANVLTALGATAATLVAAFTFTQWQNSNETEVYAVATFSIALLCWLCLVWRRRRGAGASRVLLLMLYVGGVSIGSHLLALLAGPAVVAFLVATQLSDPAPDPAARQAEWAETAVVAGAWVLLIGVGLGSGTLSAIGLGCFAIGVVLSLLAGNPGFPALALVVSSIGVTSYLYLYIRAGQHPILNEAAPDGLQQLLAVIRRAQYPVRTPLDDPTVAHGPDNPGRTLAMFGAQIVNYFQYFDWQWGNGIRATFPLAGLTIAARTGMTLLFFYLGLHGCLFQAERDRGTWWMLFTLFLITGFGLLVYMNFKPGFSLFYDRYPNGTDHEVRERDYFFVVSFVVWGLWAGLGLGAMALELRKRGKGVVRRLGPPAVLSLALLPFLLNFRAATRRQGPDARLAADFAYDLLNSVPPYGILFTYGDNDTFPLWWAQEVGGIRRDVTVVCLALAQTDWYMRQLRDNPVREFDEATAPSLWQGLHPVRPDWPLHTMTDQEITAVHPTRLSDSLRVRMGPVSHTFPPQTVLYSNDVLVIRVLQQNFGRRPIAWAVTTGRDFQGLDGYVVQQGLVNRLFTVPPDVRADSIAPGQLGSGAIDIHTTSRLAWDTYRYAGLLEGNHDWIDPTSAGVAGNLVLSFTQLATVYDTRGDTAQTLRNLERAAQLSPRPEVRETLEQVRRLLHR